MNADRNLDPTDWDHFQELAHVALSGMIDFLRNAGEGKVWEAAPEEALQTFRAPLPRKPRDLGTVLQDFETSIKPYATGNTHPMFFGWVHGAGTPVGMVAEMLAAGLNANCGGRNHIGIEVERQIVRWSADLFGFPGDASGLFVTGTSAANLIALLVARNQAAGSVNVRQAGVRGLSKQLTAYTSAEAHGCVAQAMEMSGIGSEYLRRIPVEGNGALRLDLLQQAIASDRNAGLQPFLVVGTAGTVNTGAFDDLNGIASIARNEGLWFHIDGAFGALVGLAPSLKHLLSGCEKADSIAFDFHKWAHVPYDAGFVLVRDARAHHRAFGSPAAYLQRAEAGLAAGDIWPCDLGPDLSRGFRALKTWFTFQALGADNIGAAIEQTVHRATQLRAGLAESEVFEVYPPSNLNIVCFGHKDDPTGAMNRAIAVDLHERGAAAPSITLLNGKAVLRAAILNHRTTSEHIATFVRELHRSARSLQSR